MENNKVFVVIDLEAGWDCVRGVYSSFESLRDFFLSIYEDGENEEDLIAVQNSEILDDLEDFVNDASPFVIHKETIK